MGFNIKKTIFVLAFVFCCIGVGGSKVYGEENIYYSTTRAPIFYGAQEVHLKLGEEFDPNDPRYRVFAKDFEDGDVTNQIHILSNNVNNQQLGNYSVEYKVTDSHGNESLFATKVIFSDSTNSKVIRKVYNNFSTWNTELQGISRADRQDRQMLGIGIPDGKMAEVKVVEGPDLKISVVTNDSRTDGQTKTVTKNSYTEISSKSGHSVPFVYTPLNTKQEADLEKEILIEVKLTNDVEKLPYYRQGDNEELFFQKWDQQVDKYAVIDGEALTVLVPYMDRNKLVNHWKKSFKTLDSFLDYYKKVRDRFDQLIGLETQPASSLNQVVKTKFFVRANANGAGAAYYGTDHIGVNKPSVASFFEANWGGLHEVGHGYQGGLKSGTMALGEISNNFLAYEIQHDKEIYPWNDYFMDVARDEQTYNNQRLNENKTFHDLNLAGQFYVLENLLQSFNKEMIYSAMNRWYRQQRLMGKNPRNEEAWIRTFASEANVNILPYFDVWGISVSDNLREELFNLKNLKNVSILGETVNDPTVLEEIKITKNKKKYSVITNSELANYNLNGSLTFKLSEETFDLVKNKKIQLVDGNEVIMNIPITQKEFVINTIPIGTYSVITPYINEHYFVDPQWITIRQDQNSEININYEKRTAYKYDGDQFYIQGIYNTDGIRGILNKDLTNLTIKLGGANLGNGSWPENQLYSSVTIVDGQDNSIKKTYQVNGKGYYSYLDPNNLIQEISVKLGDKIKIYHERPVKVNFVSGITNEVNTINATNTKETEYVITSTGFKKVSLTDESYQESIYQLKKNQASMLLRQAMNELSQEELENKYSRINYKNNLILLYNSLREVDREEFTDFIEKIRKGGTPRLQSQSNSIVIQKNEKIDLYSLVKAIDPEDGELTLNAENTTIETAFDSSIAGRYSVKYIVMDSDNNKSTIELVIQVIDNGEGDNDNSGDSGANGEGDNSNSGDSDTNGGTNNTDNNSGVDINGSMDMNTNKETNNTSSTPNTVDINENYPIDSMMSGSTERMSTKIPDNRSITRSTITKNEQQSPEKKLPKTSETDSNSQLLSKLGIVIFILLVISKRYLINRYRSE